MTSSMRVSTFTPVRWMGVACGVWWAWPSSLLLFRASPLRHLKRQRRVNEFQEERHLAYLLSAQTSLVAGARFELTTLRGYELYNDQLLSFNQSQHLRHFANDN